MIGGEALGLVRPHDAGGMAKGRASRLINSPKNDSPECLDPAA